MKVRSTGGTPHQFGLKPAKKMFQSSNQVGIKAIKNAYFQPKKFVAQGNGANKKTDQKVTKAAFRLFSKANQPKS